MTGQPSLFEDEKPADPPKHVVEYVAGILKQHIVGDRKLKDMERIDVEQIARVALRETTARLR